MMPLWDWGRVADDWPCLFERAGDDVTDAGVGTEPLFSATMTLWEEVRKAMDEEFANSIIED
jgi:hypothetical protein